MGWGVAALYLGFAYCLFSLGSSQLSPALAIAVVYGVAAGAAAWAFAVGRATGARWVTLTAAAALVALPLVARAWLLTPAARGILSFQVGDRFVTTPSITGLTLTAVLAGAAVTGVTRVRRDPTGPPVPFRPWLVGMLSALFAAYLVFEPGENGSALGAFLPYVAAVGLGAIAATVGVNTERRWMTVVGWIAISGLPFSVALFAIWEVIWPFEGDLANWAMLYFSIPGYLLSVAMGLVGGVWAIVSPTRRNRPRDTGEGRSR